MKTLGSVPSENGWGQLSENVGVSSGEIGQPLTHMEKSVEFMDNIYPVAQGGVKGVLSGVTMPISASTPGILYDLMNVETARQVFGARSGVGVVPSDPAGGEGSGYFYCHSVGPGHLAGFRSPLNFTGTRGLTLSDTSGFTDLGLPVSLVEEGWWEVTAHEIAHQFGVSGDTSGELFGDNQVFDVGDNRSIDHTVGNVWQLMTYTPGTTFFENLTQAWIEGTTFGSIFKKLLVNPADPKTLLLSGIIQDDGQVALDSSYVLDHGVSTPFISSVGTSIKGIDSSGNMISQASFLGPESLQVTDYKGDVSGLTAAPFVVQIPFSPNLESVQIVSHSQTLMTISPGSQLIVDAIKNVPDDLYKNKEMRRRLLAKAEELDDLDSKCKQARRGRNNARDIYECKERIVRIMLDLREDVKHFLSDSTVTLSPLQLTQADVVKVIDAAILIAILKTRVVESRSKSILILPLPRQDLDDRTAFKITQVTQAAHGKVDIIFKGMASRYTSFGHRSEGDSFSYTMSSPEGDLVTIRVDVTSRLNEGK